MADGFVLELKEQVGLPLAAKRKAQAGPNLWPAGTRIVSADSHMLEGDLWIERYPEELKHRAPRMEFKDGGWHFHVEGRPMMPQHVAAGLCEAMECNPGFLTVPPRLEDLDIEGVEKELIFPQRLFGLYMGGDFDMREHIFAAYNQHIAEVCAQAPDRLYAVMIPNYWNPDAAQESVQECKRLGARALMVPINPRKDVNGEDILYNHPKMDPFFAAVAESGIPLCFHIGENVPTNLPGAAGTFVLTQMQGFRPIFGALTFGGVFDRHPGLKVVFVEGGISWVASAIHDADMIYTHFPTAMNPQLAHPPSWYWFNHCYATFMTDPVGLEILHRIGADRVMWSSDYPHQESTFGYTRSAIQAVFDATSVENAQKIVGLTAMNLFRMD
jgi:predicted TIM-barrel fold metal-dependent hydrolase